MGKISVDCVKSSEQHADMLKKALSRAPLQYHRKNSMDIRENDGGTECCVQALGGCFVKQERLAVSRSTQA